MTPLRQRMLEDMRIRNFTEQTQKRYIGAVAAFARHFDESPERLGPEEVRTYQMHLIEKRSMKIWANRALRRSTAWVFNASLPRSAWHASGWS